MPLDLETKKKMDALLKNTVGENPQAVFGGQRPSITDRIAEIKSSKSTTFMQDYNEDAQSAFDNAGNRLVRAGESIAETIADPNLKTTDKVVKAGSQFFKGIGQFIGGGALDIVKTLVPQKVEDWASGKIEGVAESVMDSQPVKELATWYSELSPEERQGADNVLGYAEGLSELFAVKGAGGLSNKLLDIAKRGTEAGVDTTKSVVSATTKGVASVVPKTKDAFLKFVSPSVDEKTVTALKRATTDKFDDFVKTAEEASIDGTKPSVYEKVAGGLEDATRQLDSQVKSLSEQKATIISKAKNGLTDFTKETGDTVLKINRELSDNPLAKRFIDRLKAVKTKIDADKAIDDLQNELYVGNKNMTIPTGSTEDKILKSLLGEYNSTLKASLPKAYADINAEISNRLNVLGTLNTALGETVDGVATRGAGLVKQFFSPAGTKAKEIFDYIKQTTGVDVATDATLAKYIGEAFGDAKVRSLLEGVPTSAPGIIERTLDFTLEKVGAKSALEKAKRAGMLEKARAEIIKPKGITPKTKSLIETTKRSLKNPRISQGGYLDLGALVKKGKVNDELKSIVSDEIYRYDMTPVKVGKKQVFGNTDAEFTISRLKDIIEQRALKNKEVLEAVDALKKVGIDITDQKTFRKPGNVTDEFLQNL